MISSIKTIIILFTILIVIMFISGCTSSTKDHSTSDPNTTVENQERGQATVKEESGQTADKEESGQTTVNEDSGPTAGQIVTIRPDESSEEDVEILIAAAASLEHSLEEELIPMFERENPDITVKGTYDSSGKLQSQIEEGLDADIFFSAAVKQMDSLEKEGFIQSDSRMDLLKNKLVMIVPVDSTAGFNKFTDIVKAGQVAIGDPDSVPAGQYAKEAFTNLGLWDKVIAKASLGTNVTEVLTWVSEGSADAGIVYITDAMTLPDKVMVAAEAPEGSLESEILYPVAVLNNSTKKDAASKFMDFLNSNEASSVFEKYGFIKK